MLFRNKSFTFTGWFYILIFFILQDGWEELSQNHQEKHKTAFKLLPNTFISLQMSAAIFHLLKQQKRKVLARYHKNKRV